MRFLVIQTAFLGDAVISLALAEELRRLAPESLISYLVRPEVAPVIRLSPSVDRVFSFDKYGSESGISGVEMKAEELNAAGFDFVFNLHRSKRTAMLLDRLSAKRKVGYGDSSSLTDQVLEIVEPRTSRAVRLLTVLFRAADLGALPRLLPGENSLPDGVKSLQRPIVTIAPDSVWNTKQWGIARFLALIDRLMSSKCSIILTGSKREDTLEESHNRLNNRLLDLSGKTNLEQLAAVIKHSDLLISNDSGTVHIATAVQTKSIVLFGPTVPEFGFAPPSALGQVIQSEGLWCRPCASHGSNECPIHTHECMTGISPEVVFDKAMEALGA